jgi:phosphoribosylformylglycinamidine synthase
MEIQQIVGEKLASFVNSPSVTVTVQEIRSKKIYVIGEVSQTGAYQITQPTTILQILTEAGLLPGALRRNDRLTFICRPQSLRIETTDTLFTRQYEHGQVVSFPIAHAEGNFAAEPGVIDRLEGEQRVVFRYVDDRGADGPDANPNGSINDIAGVINERGNVLGLMPHPDRAMDRVLGSADGRGIFQGLVEAAA